MNKIIRYAKIFLAVGQLSNLKKYLLEDTKNIEETKINEKLDLIQRYSFNFNWFVHRFIFQKKHFQDIDQLLKTTKAYSKLNKELRTFAFSDDKSFSDLYQFLSQFKSYQIKNKEFSKPQVCKEILRKGNYIFYYADANNKECFNDLHKCNMIDPNKEDNQNNQYAKWCVVTGTVDWGDYTTSEFPFYVYVTTLDNQPIMLFNFGYDDDAQIKDVHNNMFAYYDQDLIKGIEQIAQKYGFNIQDNDDDFYIFNEYKDHYDSDINQIYLDDISDNDKNKFGGLYLWEQAGIIIDLNNMQKAYFIIDGKVQNLKGYSYQNSNLINLMLQKEDYILNKAVQNLVLDNKISDSNFIKYICNYLLSLSDKYKRISFLIMVGELIENKKVKDKKIIEQAVEYMLNIMNVIQVQSILCKIIKLKMIENEELINKIIQELYERKSTFFASILDLVKDQNMIDNFVKYAIDNNEVYLVDELIKNDKITDQKLIKEFYQKNIKDIDFSDVYDLVSTKKITDPQFVHFLITTTTEHNPHCSGRLYTLMRDGLIKKNETSEYIVHYMVASRSFMQLKLLFSDGLLKDNQLIRYVINQVIVPRKEYNTLWSAIINGFITDVDLLTQVVQLLLNNEQYLILHSLIERNKIHNINLVNQIKTNQGFIKFCQEKNLKISKKLFKIAKTLLARGQSKKLFDYLIKDFKDNFDEDLYTPELQQNFKNKISEIQKDSFNFTWFVHRFIFQNKHFQDIDQLLKTTKAYSKLNKELRTFEFSDNNSFGDLYQFMDKFNNVKNQYFKAPTVCKLIHSDSKYNYYYADANNIECYYELHKINTKKNGQQYAMWCVVTGTKPWGSYVDKNKFPFYIYVTNKNNVPYILMNFGYNRDAQIKDIHDSVFGKYDTELINSINKIANDYGFDIMESKSQFNSLADINKFQDSNKVDQFIEYNIDSGINNQKYFMCKNKIIDYNKKQLAYIVDNYKCIRQLYNYSINDLKLWQLLKKNNDVYIASKTVAENQLKENVILYVFEWIVKENKADSFLSDILMKLQNIDESICQKLLDNQKFIEIATLIENNKLNDNLKNNMIEIFSTDQKAIGGLLYLIYKGKIQFNEKYYDLINIDMGKDNVRILYDLLVSQTIKPNQKIYDIFDYYGCYDFLLKQLLINDDEYIYQLLLKRKQYSALIDYIYSFRNGIPQNIKRKRQELLDYLIQQGNVIRFDEFITKFKLFYNKSVDFICQHNLSFWEILSKTNHYGGQIFFEDTTYLVKKIIQKSNMTEQIIKKLAYWPTFNVKNDLVEYLINIDNNKKFIAQSALLYFSLNNKINPNDYIIQFIQKDFSFLIIELAFKQKLIMIEKLKKYIRNYNGLDQKQKNRLIKGQTI